MAFKKLSFEESLESEPLSEEEYQALQDEIESNDYYNSIPTVRDRNPSLWTMASNESKADRLQAIFDDLPTTHKEYWQAYQIGELSLGDIENLVYVLYDSELI